MSSEKSSETSAEFTRLLEYLRSARGFDFTGYKISSLMRRIRKRMSEVEVAGDAEYIDFLEVHPEEFSRLFNTVLINVTSFFRDPEAWQYLAEQVISRILEEKGRKDTIRVWSAGCAAGQEAYSVAILLAEALGEEEFKARIKIYATDADEDALTQARQASYDDRQIEEVPPELRARYFETVNGRHVFRTDLRRCLIFGRHDLVQDAAISRVDLLICRNTLMYFNVETQSKILARFHFALAQNGYLFLGKAETLLAHGGSFRPVDLKRRVFQRVPSTNLRDRLLAIAPAAHGETANGQRHGRLRDAAFDHGPVAQLVVDRKGLLLQANLRARRLFGIAVSDLGRQLQDLDVSYRPADLRSALDEVYEKRAPFQANDVVWREEDGQTLQLELLVLPVTDETGGLLGASVSFPDHTQAKALRKELERASQELETAYEELQSANEELETTNEELQSTVEELETTNEELQSANEELETMNEELQSTNEELRTVNDQLHLSTSDLNRLNGLLESILGSLSAGVVVLDRDLVVTAWSTRAEDLWGLRREEAVGKPFLKLDIGLPVGQLRQPIRECLAGTRDGEIVTLDGVNRRGKTIRCRITCRVLDGDNGSGQLLLVMEEAPQPRPVPTEPS
ncbi:MAG TPA: CheR family methyltransferase [Thermoanaerobaculia bacterium]|nr:CheR family methyltransferase [Thermoanaerobaculia bacterium]